MPLTSLKMIHTIDKFIISSFTQFSDHASLHLEIKIKNVNFTDELITDCEPDYGVERKTFKWRDEYKSQCKETLANNIDNLNSLCENLNFESQDGIDKTVSDFSEFLNGIMSPYFKVRPKVSTSRKKQDRIMPVIEDKPWFNDEFKPKATGKEVFDHFKRIASEINSEENSRNGNSNNDEIPVYEELDCVITNKEILCAISSLKRNVIYDDMLDCEISVEEVFNVLKSSKNGKSPGYDEIPVELYKNQTMLNALTRVFNICFDSGKVPAMWSKGIITPIPKSSTSDPRDPLSYRGITLAPVSYKLYCGVLNSRLTYKLDDIDFLCDEQNGFRKGRSTVDHLSTLATIIETRKLRKQSTYVAFIDFKKAYDWINRNLLFCKLKTLETMSRKIHGMKREKQQRAVVFGNGVVVQNMSICDGKTDITGACGITYSSDYQITKLGNVYHSGGSCSSPNVCTDCTPGFYSDGPYCRLCGTIDHCNYRRCTTSSNQICEWCDGEITPNTYWRAYTRHLDNTKCQSK
ncbi:unnamed protein product [Mytilus edulis]|uniref:Reverse transcriptase domain-containing protein n=1 Tax=Mytilus edulis TaxID=6550 RepID=A0A8S3TPC3_MYTED|nr:unnamed protein product [Mytilus edulis]